MQFLRWLTISFLVAVVTILISGCGGGSSSSTGGSALFTKTPVPVQLEFPLGYSGPGFSDLSVWTSSGESTPEASGQATAVIYNGGPQYADVRDSQGRIVLAGFVGEDLPDLNSESTAELLAFFATGGAYLVDNGPEVWLDGISTMNGFDEVVAAVESQLSAQGYIDVQAAPLKNALEAMASGLSDQGRGTIVDPSSDSGISIDTSVDGEMTVTNVYLRRLVGFLQRTGYRNSDNQFVEDPGPVTRVDVDPVKRFSGVVGTITDLGRGQIAYSPVTAGPLPIPFEGPAGTEATVYQLRIGGLGAKDTYPNLFKGDELDAHRTVVMKTLLLDGIFPVILKVLLPLQGSNLDDILAYTNGNAIFGEMLNTLMITAPGIYDLAAQGKNEDALIAAYEAFVGSGPVLTLFAQFAIQLGEHFSLDFYAKSGTISEGVSERLALLGIVDLIGSSADLILFFRDVAVSEKASKFEILSTGGKATILPDKPTLLVDESTTMSVVIQDKNPDAVYRYEWSVNEGYVVSNANGTTNEAPGGVLVGSSETASVTNEIGNREVGTAIVRCKVVRIDGADDKPVDTPTVEINFVKVTVTPNPATVQPGEKVTLTGKLEGKGQVFWKYSLESTELGTINRVAIGNNPDVIFTAGPEKGTATLVAEAYTDALGAKKLATLNVPILIGDVVGIPVTVLYASALYDEYPSSWVGVVGAYLESLPTVQGAFSYNLLRDGVKVTSWDAGRTPTGDENTDEWKATGAGGYPIYMTVMRTHKGTINGVDTRIIMENSIATELANLKAYYDGHLISIQPVFEED